VGDSWHVGETCIKARGQWVYFVRAGDKEGRIGDFLFFLSKRRDVMSAKRLFSQRIRPTIGFKGFDTATVRCD
jgi:transposase-like protein